MFEAAVVAIEAPGSPAYVAAAVKGCSSALGTGRCTDWTTTGQAEWHAIVRTATSSDPRVMVIEVRRNGVLFRRRILRFTDRDAVGTRWSTAGAVVAAIISGELDQADPDTQPSLPPPEPDPAESNAEDIDVATDPIDPIDGFIVAGPAWYEIRGAALELLLTGGTEVYRGRPELGVLSRGKLTLVGGPYLSLGVAGAAVPDNPLILQTDGFVGFGVPISLSAATALDVGASFVSEWLWLQHETGSGRTDTAQTWRFGAALDADFRVRLVGRWAAVVGARATFLRPEVDVRRPVRPDGPSRQLAIVLPAGLGLGLGIRYDFGDGWL